MAATAPDFNGRRRKRIELPEHEPHVFAEPESVSVDEQQIEDNAEVRTERAPLDFGMRCFLYLVALTLAEITTVLIDTRWGIVGHAVILTLLVTQASLDMYNAGNNLVDGVRPVLRKQANFLASLSLVPTIRIVSLAMPLSKFPEWAWYGLISVPLLAATWAAIRAAGYSRQELGLVIPGKPVAIALMSLVGLSGIGLGYLEYQILRPDPLVDNPSPVLFIGICVMLMIGTGLTEELIFRGVLQIAGAEVFGLNAGILFSAALFAILHIGHRSFLDVVFVFLVAVVFGLIVRYSRSLAGVTIAHGLTNICLFVVFPHLLG